jgi:phage-related protein
VLPSLVANIHGPSLGRERGRESSKWFEDFRGDTFRAVYTVRFEGAVYVLHAFQKKSRRGSKTASTDIELIGKRLRAAQEDYETRFSEK